ncbi:Glycerophosphodiester phosphodiesterase GDPDL3 [Linum perenne]
MKENARLLAFIILLLLLLLSATLLLIHLFLYLSAGNHPLVVARGGFSAFGICAPDLKLDNSTDINKVYQNRQSTYTVNGVKQAGWFPSDFTSKELQTVSLAQGVYSRSPNYDTNSFPILTVDDVAGFKPVGLWLNVQHDAFYTQQNLSMRSYVIAASKRVVINYISSPEVGFLRSISTRFNPNITKLFFRFNGEKETEPTTNQTYGSLLSNLTFVRTFASGIIVPKTYIWPVDASNYLESSSNTVVLDAHKAGLEVFASDFFNDGLLSYNYSYDPVSEYLNFVDNGQFSVDGVLSDYPITPSAAFDCFSHLGQNASENVKFLVISKNGASGDYPGCTDIAYQTAISDGADVIDCPIQMSQDGIPFCQSSINLIETTKAAETLNNFTTVVPELQGSGIYSFSLPWTQIQPLAPVIFNPYPTFQLFRNPKMRNAGKLVSLADFLALAKDNEKSLSGVLIKIENAAYLMEKQGLAVLDAVETELNKAGYGNQTALKVMIQSTNSSVLMKLKDKNNKYELVYQVDETIGGANPSAISEMKEFADSVVISKTSVFPVNDFYLTGITDVVSKLQSAELPVYVETFSNEFASQPWDFFADANVELNTYISGTNITGVVTDFPKTSARFKSNDDPLYMLPVKAGSLLGVILPPSLPPAQAPMPPLTENDIAEAPLPAVGDKPSAPTPPGAGATPPSPSNGEPKVVAYSTVSGVAMLLFTSLLLLSS